MVDYSQSKKNIASQSNLFFTLRYNQFHRAHITFLESCEFTKVYYKLFCNFFEFFNALSIYYGLGQR